MKRIIFFILVIRCLFGVTVQAQINLAGTTTYQLNTVGMYTRDNNGCGNIDGLRYVRVFYANGSNAYLINFLPSRLINSSFNYYTNYAKSNRITRVEIQTTLRWDIWSGCNGGPNDHFTSFPVSGTCFSYYNQRPVDYLYNFTITSRPVVQINTVTTPLYLNNRGYLNIALTDNIDTQYYRWKYKVGNGAEQFFPDSLNNKAVLNARGDQFLTPADFGQTVSVWLAMGCEAGDRLAWGLAATENYPTFSNTLYNRYIPIYQSMTSNAITFTYLIASPRITATQKQDVGCYSESTGSATFSFDRNLNPGESLNLVLNQKSPVTGSYEFYASHINLTSLTEENTTFDNLPAGDYRLDLIGLYNGFPTYTDDADQTAGFTISQPTPVTFNITNTVNIRCNGGHDGQIEVIADGGSGNYQYQAQYPDGNFSEWTAFNDGNRSLLLGLDPGTYNIQVMDGAGCLAKQVVYNNGVPIGVIADAIITKTAVLTEPSEPVAVTYVDKKEPTSFGFSNGYIKAQITGGTPYAGSKMYDYIWQYEDGTIGTNVIEETIPGNEGWFLTLTNAKSGTYTLTVSDANYSEATDTAGCTIYKSEFTLDQPDPLQASIRISKQISCNTDNEYGNETDISPQDGQRDESQDGALTATINGGTKPYICTWKKQINGVWTVITTQTDAENTSTAYELSDGNYAFNVQDAQGNVLGEYSGNDLVAAKDSVFYLNEPPALTLTLKSTDLACNTGNDGSIIALPEGGVAPYSYQWTNGETTQQINDLIAGAYKVIVIDARGCHVEGNIVLNQPASMEINTATVNPTCFGSSDGSISASVTGGTEPYRYQWSNETTEPVISGLSAGDYMLTVIDAGGCTAITNVSLTEPEKIVIDLGGDRVLCKEQSLDLDASIPYPNSSYLWSSANGFHSTSAKVTLTDAGTYTVTATTPLGCTATDQITITRSNTDIDSEFLISSQAYVNEEVVLINVSNPLGQKTDWAIPDGVEIIGQAERDITLKFPEEGTYAIGLTSTQGECSQYFEKNIVVEKNDNLPDPGATTSPFIQEFTLAPNPNGGNFLLTVKLADTGSISLRVFDFKGALVSGPKTLQGQKAYAVDYQLSGMTPGTYLVVLETAKGTQVIRMIIF